MLENKVSDPAIADVIIHTAINGEKSRGDNGAVLVDTENSTIVYLLTHEFQPDNFREKLEDLLSEDNNQHIFVVFKSKTDMHVSKMARVGYN